MAEKGKSPWLSRLLLIGALLQLLGGLLWNLKVVFGSSPPPGGFAVGGAFLASGALFLIIGLAIHSKARDKPGSMERDSPTE